MFSFIIHQSITLNHLQHLGKIGYWNKCNNWSKEPHGSIYKYRKGQITGIMRLQQDIYQNFLQGKPNPYMLPLKETSIKLYDIKRAIAGRQPNRNFSLMIFYFLF